MILNPAALIKKQNTDEYTHIAKQMSCVKI